MDAEKSSAFAHYENSKEGEFEEQLAHLANQEDHELGRWAAIKFVPGLLQFEIVADRFNQCFVENVHCPLLGASSQCGLSF